jgi:hypothetical protein
MFSLSEVAEAVNPSDRLLFAKNLSEIVPTPKASGLAPFGSPFSGGLLLKRNAETPGAISSYSHFATTLFLLGAHDAD